MSTPERGQQAHQGQRVGPKAADGTWGWRCDDDCPHPDHSPSTEAWCPFCMTFVRPSDDHEFEDGDLTDCNVYGGAVH